MRVMRTIPNYRTKLYEFFSSLQILIDTGLKKLKKCQSIFDWDDFAH